ncbi:heme oxygenase [Pedobacter lusitanus]|uniref:Heme oxygenase n=1 Tax=Pedobacter lusitanus TaxID=1503925 RepID=A0A0D0FUM1_9SPHI|nr:biliverdin-producing heme oxygenase [Pedobacter lusitanus]KIO76139.1 heme oxygenase [Pedobacter lusitanus]
MISSIIKDATMPAHKKLEKQVILKLKAIRSNEDYSALLKNFNDYFDAVEKAIAPYINPEVLADYGQRRNSAYIKRDITELGGDPIPAASVEVPEIQNSLDAMAALYVMEGSIMGGKIIVQMLAKAGITKGVSFFSGYGEDTGRLWGTFIKALDRTGTNEEDEKRAVKIANDTFNCFAKVF